jgi:hypothetical protein
VKVETLSDEELRRLHDEISLELRLREAARVGKSSRGRSPHTPVWACAVLQHSRLRHGTSDGTALEFCHGATQRKQLIPRLASADALLRDRYGVGELVVRKPTVRLFFVRVLGCYLEQRDQEPPTPAKLLFSLGLLGEAVSRQLPGYTPEVIARVVQEWV